MGCTTLICSKGNNKTVLFINEKHFSKQTVKTQSKRKVHFLKKNDHYLTTTLTIILLCCDGKCFSFLNWQIFRQSLCNLHKQTFHIQPILRTGD